MKQLKISWIPTCQRGSMQSKLWLISCHPRIIFSPFLNFRTITILQLTYHWGKTIIKNSSNRICLLQTHIHISKLQKLGVIGKWERWPFVLFFKTNMHCKIIVGKVSKYPWPPMTYVWLSWSIKICVMHAWHKFWWNVKPHPLFAL